MDEQSPRPARTGHDRPVDGSFGNHLDALFDRHRVAPDPAGIDVVQQPGGGRPAKADQRALKLGQLQGSAADPGDHRAQRLVGGVLEARPLDVRIGIVHLHLVRTGVIGGGDDRPREGFLTELGTHRDRLTGSHIGTHSNGELGQRSGVLGHRPEASAWLARILAALAAGCRSAARALAFDGDDPASQTAARPY